MNWLEAQDAIALCGVIEDGGTDLPGVAHVIAPAGWELVYDSPVIGAFDNKWQLWRSPGADRWAIVIRGTVASNVSSIVEDLLATMIPARGILALDGGRGLHYCFSMDPDAKVHLGFALGALLLAFDNSAGILAQVSQLVPAGADLILTGHSQGAAIATLLRALFAYLQALGVPWRSFYGFPTYAFAQPKPGNPHFAHDYEMLPLVFRFTNPFDWVPQVPLSLQFLAGLNPPNPISTLPIDAAVRMLIGILTEVQNLGRAAHLAKFLPQIDLLGKMTIWPEAGALIAPTGDPSIPFAAGLDFEPAGIPISLPGGPGINPVNPKDDGWQHHAAMYASLLQELAGTPRAGALGV